MAKCKIARTGTETHPWQVCYTDPSALASESLAAELDGSCWHSQRAALLAASRILDLVENGER